MKRVRSVTEKVRKEENSTNAVTGSSVQHATNTRRANVDSK